MVTPAGEPLFLDTNVLVYASERRAPFHAEAVRVVQDEYRAGTRLWISRQELREYLATLTRPHTWGVPQATSQLAADVRLFEAQCRVAEDGAHVTARLLALLEQFPVGGKQIYDANIVATMQSYGIGRPLAHDAADFARFASVISVVPLAPAG